MQQGDVINYCLANNLPTLVWAANLADIELHTTLGKCRKPERPTMMVFDLDPGAPADLLNCAEVAFWLKEIFDQWKLQAFPKVSGSKGLQIYIPLNTPVTYDQTKPLAQSLAELLERQHPREVVSKQAKERRRGKVLVDWSQNEFFKTTICVYSLRAKDAPTVSMPVTWAELEKGRRSGKRESLVFEAEAAVKRLEKMGDLFEPVLTLKQKLPK
jgi:bifunctional non-homologous end joining protein LigD